MQIVFLSIFKGLAPAINPQDYLKPQKPKRRIKPRTYENFKSVNLVEKHSLRAIAGNTSRIKIFLILCIQFVLCMDCQFMK